MGELVGNCIGMKEPLHIAHEKENNTALKFNE